MAKYTYKDVIIDPEDPRVEIGKEYWFGSGPKQVIDKANGDNSTSMLREIRPNLERPFLFSSDMNSDIGMAPCMIRKKEPKKKYVPFDLSNEIDRRFLSCRWIQRKNDTGTHIYMITGFHCTPGCNLIAAGNISVNPKDLLEKYEFSDGEPCGKMEE